MQNGADSIKVRVADLSGRDGATVSKLVRAYLLQTETEKAQHLGQHVETSELPERYRAELEDPARAYADAVVYLAEADTPVGVLVLQRDGVFSDLKRVWVDPSARGRRVGSALIDAALRNHAHRPVRLTVWDWRDDAIRLYRTRGFLPVASWEDRRRLVCMELR